MNVLSKMATAVALSALFAAPAYAGGFTLGGGGSLGAGFSVGSNASTGGSTWKSGGQTLSQKSSSNTETIAFGDLTLGVGTSGNSVNFSAEVGGLGQNSNSISTKNGASTGSASHSFVNGALGAGGGISAGGGITTFP